ncbi:MAG: ATP-dependent 6-phosphofructokinase [Spirulina sp. SIO3F2]|nr:ATP-dependent 6-phosphofructokinase [Spirulina sp. SIO3F2]
MSEKKRIGILTSGGDCAGLNPIIRAVVNRATRYYGWEVLGIQGATNGLMQRPPKVMPLHLNAMDPLRTQGGTILGTTNKGNPFAFPMPDGSLKDRSPEIIDGYYQLGLDTLIGIGGDGSLAILRKLAQQGGMKLIGIPKTIDNDVGETQLSIGFSTAVDIATDALDRLHFTAASHDRVMILEVMGRDAGHIALQAGIAGGAHIILIPEIPYSLGNICRKIQERQDAGFRFSIVIVSEAVCTEGGETVQKMEQFWECRLGGIGQYLANAISKSTGAETRVTVLGHIQRGGIPSPTDRLLASAFGVAAVDLIADGKEDMVVTWQNNQIVPVPIADAIKTYRQVNPEDTLVHTARGLGICLGD